MANRWDAVESAILTIVKALSGVDGAAWGWLPTHSGIYAGLTWGPGDYIHQGGFTQDWVGQFNVRLSGTDASKLKDVVDLLSVCFFKTANRTTLAGVKASVTIPATSDPPIVWPGGKNNLILDILFNIEIESTYTLT